MGSISDARSAERTGIYPSCVRSGKGITYARSADGRYGEHSVPGLPHEHLRIYGADGSRSGTASGSTADDSVMTQKKTCRPDATGLKGEVLYT